MCIYIKTKVKHVCGFECGTKWSHILTCKKTYSDVPCNVTFYQVSHQVKRWGWYDNDNSRKQKAYWMYLQLIQLKYNGSTFVFYYVCVLSKTNKWFLFQRSGRGKLRKFLVLPWKVNKSMSVCVMYIWRKVSMFGGFCLVLYWPSFHTYQILRI